MEQRVEALRPGSTVSNTGHPGRDREESPRPCSEPTADSGQRPAQKCDTETSDTRLPQRATWALGKALADRAATHMSREDRGRPRSTRPWLAGGRRARTGKLWKKEKLEELQTTSTWEALTDLHTDHQAEAGA